VGRFGLSPRLWTWLHKNISRFDGVVVQGIWTFPGLAVRHAARRFGKTFCVFPHGSLDPWFNRQYPVKHLKKKIYWPIQYPVLRDAAAVFFTSATEAALAKESFSPNGWNGQVFPYGIHEPAGDAATQIEAFHAALPALGQRRFLLFLARIQEKKGCDLLVAAFARVAAFAPDLDLVIAGPDQVGWQSTLQKMAESLGVGHRIHWPGMLSGERKWGALRAAEAFVLPSHQENFGIAVVESLAAGRPVLISNQVNIWHEIQDDGAGLVDDDTLEGTERLLERWFELPPEEREKMVLAAYPCFRKRFCISDGARIISGIFAKA
jgi:glycosyltransferase involved in cell wall biosynthesis